MTHYSTAFALTAALFASGTQLSAQTVEPTAGMFGEPGLIDMPTAEASPDGRFSNSISTYRGAARTTLSFQISPRLSGNFRYSTIDEFLGVGSRRTWDRSFDLRYILITETDKRPAVAIGLRDFVGTGIYSSEYIVATKSFNEKFAVTGGIGWGRLATANSFSNPLGVLSDRFDVRPTGGNGQGGDAKFDQWFRGDAALFAGISYQFSPDLTFKAEYSSDGYADDVRRGIFERNSSLNVGLTYSGFENVELSGYYLYGSRIGVSATVHLDPKTRAAGGGFDRGALPVRPRPAGAEQLGWDVATSRPVIQEQLATVLAADGMQLIGMQIDRDRVRVRVQNTRYGSNAQATGRVARILTQTMPASVETFVIEPMSGALASSAIEIRRSDLERFENAPDGAWEIYARSKISSAGPRGTLDRQPGQYPKFTFGLAPYTQVTLFDPDRPLRLSIGVEASGKVQLAEGLSLQGAVQKRLLGNFDDAVRAGSGPLPPVRSDGFRYLREGDPSLTYLTLEYMFRPSPQVYGRLTAGYLESMYGGVSAEVLWKPINSRLALGAEVNYVKQREFEQLFGFRDYDTVTGHLSGYYDFGNEYHAQLDVGRYLAGDVGGTLTLTREFDNGWRLGAFATLTNVSSEDFGEGSFDKGLIIEAPIDWFLGQPNQRKIGGVLRPIQRDGGARLNVQNRLYRTVKDSHRPDLESRWGRFWK